ncbi:helix-turn-helix domain-containing protein [Vreelandella zhanjiangensis]|uniref:helix-turn-helix domain-containing protein n=1 Tax=Vreelandella zhanjiangensis TaxID=1121960 RepID=UPI00402AE0BE
MIDIRLYKGSTAFQIWAANRPVMSDCKTLDTCIVSKHMRALHRALKPHWDCPVEPLATMVGMCAMIQGGRDWIVNEAETEYPSFVAAWGMASRKKTTSVDINESRFLKWAKSDGWDSFFEHSQTGMRVIANAKQEFDIRTIYHWVRFRHENPNDFALAAAKEFYKWRHLREESQKSPNATTDHDPTLAPGLVQCVIDAGYSQAEIARRCGVSREYIRLLSSGKREMSFAMQILLEHLASAS